MHICGFKEGVSLSFGLSIITVIDFSKYTVPLSVFSKIEKRCGEQKKIIIYQCRHEISLCKDYTAPITHSSDYWQIYNSDTAYLILSVGQLVLVTF